MRRLLLAWLACAGLACGDTKPLPSGVDAGALDAVPRDSGVLDAGREACRPELQVEGGGAAGEAIAGRLQIYVLAAEDRRPLAEATVVAQIDGRELVQPVGADGCALFSGPGVFGAATVSAFAAGRNYLSLVNARREGLTLVLARGGATTVQTATISGTVRGLHVLTASSATVARFAIADAITTDVFVGLPDQRPRPDNPNVAQNLALMGRSLDYRDYRLLVEAPGTRGVVLSGGNIYYPRAGRPEVRFSHYGLKSELDPAAGTWLMDQDVELVAPLGERFTLGWGAGPSFRVGFAYAYLVLAGELGWVFHAREPLALEDAAIFTDLPALAGPFAGATYGGAILVAEAERVSLLVAPGSAAPALELGALALYPEGLALDGRAISARVPGALSDELCLFALQAPGGPRWVFLFLQSTEEPALTAPAVPAGHPDPLAAGGRVELTVQRLLYQGLTLDAPALGRLEDAAIRRLASERLVVDR